LPNVANANGNAAAPKQRQRDTRQIPVRHNESHDKVNRTNDKQQRGNDGVCGQLNAVEPIEDPR